LTAGIEIAEDGRPRCWWAVGDALDLSYHDEEWGRPVAEDRRLFEKLCLEGFMSGLSWLTILRKRENFRRAFAGFEPAVVARFKAADQRRLMNDAGIVRNSAKIAAVINNARRLPELQSEFGSLAAYAWGYEPPPRARPLDHATLMAAKFSPEAAAMSKDLRQRGWAFVGPTTVQSFMEAMGLINNHIAKCNIAGEVEAQRRAFTRPKRA
jgi:DNA-3-methyladenine glycosylase I